jgi:NAD(P)-dependent dehydrogenase (short-subunit alcohol dehydrogenase family)
MAKRGRFDGRVVLVTGATSGIGRATTKALCAEGASVVLSGRRRERLDDTVESIRADGGQAYGVIGDVRDEAACRTLVETARSKFGGLDGLVNAAGVLGSGGVLETEPEEWDRVMSSNLRSLFLLTRAAAPELATRKGCVVNISSVAGSRPYPGVLAYCVSKAAVDMFTRCAALDLAPRGVRVNAVNPGVVVTELHTVTQAVPDYPAFLERSKSTHPLGRVGQPGDEASWITGVTYSIDGGRALLSAR